MNNNLYQNKYLKYKNKYLNKLVGGGIKKFDSSDIKELVELLDAYKKFKKHIYILIMMNLK